MTQPTTPQPMTPKRADQSTLLRLRQLQTIAVARNLWKELRNAAVG
jgi:hypothetical protein